MLDGQLADGPHADVMALDHDSGTPPADQAGRRHRPGAVPGHGRARAGAAQDQADLFVGQRRPVGRDERLAHAVHEVRLPLRGHLRAAAPGDVAEFDDAGLPGVVPVMLPAVRPAPDPAMTKPGPGWKIEENSRQGTDRRLEDIGPDGRADVDSRVAGVPAAGGPGRHRPRRRREEQGHRRQSSPGGDRGPGGQVDLPVLRGRLRPERLRLRTGRSPRSRGSGLAGQPRPAVPEGLGQHAADHRPGAPVPGAVPARRTAPSGSAWTWTRRWT